tara:strand:- start:37 stop:849 length:813 start_codon:yes stop_codon:yes gene_type:complete
MLDHNSEWHVTTCFSGCLTDVYYTDGDTLDNGMTYTVLNGYHYISRTFWIRENVPEQKVFMSYIDPVRGREEVLLYDYSVTVGDTIEMHNPVSPFAFDGGYFNVDSIISIPLFDGQNYRKYYFSPTANNPSTEQPVWIESLGSLTIINGPGGSPNINAVGKVSCYIKDGFLNYSQLDSISGCSAVYVTDLEEKEKNEIHIYPSPLIDELKIDASVDGLKLTIVNSQGQVLSRHLLDFNNTIDLATIQSGVYFLNFEYADQSSIVRKILKH